MPMQDTDIRSDVSVELRTGKMSRIIMWNDDTTPMDAVVLILLKVFQKDYMEAVALMLSVHVQGKGVVEECPYKLARAKRIEAMRMARDLGYPDFKITVEEK